MSFYQAGKKEKITITNEITLASSMPLSNVATNFLMNVFSQELQAKTKVNMRNMYREKHGLTCQSLMLLRLLLLTNIETDRGYLGKRRACNNL